MNRDLYEFLDISDGDTVACILAKDGLACAACITSSACLGVLLVIYSLVPLGPVIADPSRGYLSTLFASLPIRCL